MLTVNLISERRGERLRYRRAGAALSRLAVVIGLFTVSFIVVGFLTARRTENLIVQTNLAKIAYQKQADEVARLQASIAVLAPRVQMVEAADRRLDYWRYIYAQLARSMPDNVKLDSIDIDQAATGAQSIRVMGRGDNAQAVSKALLALNAQPSFSDLVMGSVTLNAPHMATLSANITLKPLPEATTSAAANAAASPGK
jgi:Tfp pilus assembly protein PilN